MKPTESVLNSDRLNYLNIGLMLLACGVAFFVPFELFFFSYAVLGPGHYLTEISWLHERKYFSRGKWDCVFLGLAAVALFLNNYLLVPYGIIGNQTGLNISTGLIYVSFAAALAMATLKTSRQRMIAIFIILGSSSLVGKGAIFFSIFLPTLVHVYVFTGLFTLYGALKGRSKSGYFSVLIFMICPLLFVFITPDAFPISSYALSAYKNFEMLNVHMLHIWDPDTYSFPPSTKEEISAILAAVYHSKLGVLFMRFIAFAYTYHYLNWFSKTSVIKWHAVPKKRLAAAGVLWFASVGIYLHDYAWGFNILFLISFLHVFLEFPLNHVSFIGIFNELRNMAGSKQAPTLAKG